METNVNGLQVFIVFRRRFWLERKEQLYNILNNELNSCENTNLFWNIYFAFIKDQIKLYTKSLDEKGIDYAFLFSSENNETYNKKIKQIESLVKSLALLNETMHKLSDESEKVNYLREKLSKKDRHLKELESALNQLKLTIDQYKQEALKKEKEYEYNKEQFAIYKKELERKLKLQSNQIKTTLNKNIQLIRDRINIIYEMVENATDEELDQLKNHVQDAIQTIVQKLSDEGLWPEGEKKPGHK